MRTRPSATARRARGIVGAALAALALLVTACGTAAPPAARTPVGVFDATAWDAATFE